MTVVSMRRASLSSVLIAVVAVGCGSTASVPVDGGSVKPDTGKGHPSGPDAESQHDAAPGSPDAHCTPATPTNHRASATPCSTSRPPSLTSDAAPPDAGFPGVCTSDSQCTGGANGRCMQGEGDMVGPVCNYDQCSTDSQCTDKGVCACGTSEGTDGRGPNICISMGNCQVDSDCGEGGYCSPSYGTECGAYGGVIGYFCHKLADECSVDECVNDSECSGQSATDGGPIVGGAGYCAFDPTSSHWVCSYSECAG
jgi:hypothetical protein